MAANNQTKRIVFLCSGAGGNLSFVQHAIKYKLLKNAKIVGVLTDRLCTANSFADRACLYNRIIGLKDQNQNDLLSELKRLQPDIIITTFHKIIGHEIVNYYQNKIINLHYSLLPAFSGLIGTKPVKAALDHHSLFSGVTVHLVNEQVDAGRPIVQAVITINEEESLESLMPAVFRCGGIALLKALSSLLTNTTFLGLTTSSDVLGHFCIFNGGDKLISNNFINDESFWLKIQESVK